MKTTTNRCECLKCGYIDNINRFNVTPLDESDPNPVIECPKCGGCAEFIDDEVNIKHSIEKIDFLNNRFRKMKQPWYKLAVNHSWSKINKWCKILGYNEQKRFY